MNRKVAKSQRRAFFSHGFTQIITDKKIIALRAKGNVSRKVAKGFTCALWAVKSDVTHNT
jgi:hypothetical protein